MEDHDWVLRYPFYREFITGLENSPHLIMEKVSRDKVGSGVVYPPVKIVGIMHDLVGEELTRFTIESLGDFTILGAGLIISQGVPGRDARPPNFHHGFMCTLFALASMNLYPSNPKKYMEDVIEKAMGSTGVVGEVVPYLRGLLTVNSFDTATSIH